MRYTIAGAVKKGIARLSRKRSTWFKTIDIETLDMDSPRRCILGQVFGNYFDGCRELGIEDKSDVQYGFICRLPQPWYAHSLVKRRLASLRREWVKNIKRLRTEYAVKHRKA